MSESLARLQIYAESGAVVDLTLIELVGHEIDQLRQELAEARVEQDRLAAIIRKLGAEQDLLDDDLESLYDWICFSTGPEQVCERCEGDGQAHGADRPFDWSGPGTYPGPCPVCQGSGKRLGNVPLSPRATGGGHD